MAAPRNLVFCNEFIYHLFNRGVERRPIFLTTRDYDRFVSLLEYYRFKHLPKSFSHYLALSLSEREAYRVSLNQTSTAVDILAYCLMPNHFHLLVRQTSEQGIFKSLSKITNGYAKFFNTKRHRPGPLFQGPFKAVRVETDEQLLHLSRYIHINPVVSGIVSVDGLASYPWSSLSVYLQEIKTSFVMTQFLLDHFKTIHSYKTFVFDQINYVKELEKVKHLVLEGV